MRSFLSAIVFAASLVLLVPDNGAQAVNAAEPLRVAVTGEPATADPVVREGGNRDENPMDSDAALLLALGFLGAVMARRLRPD
jgi:hypothetical protein